MAATNSDICFGSDTICALSSGRPPAAIAIVRLSGPRAGDILAAIAGTLPVPRHASLRDLRDADGELLDRALVLWFPGPETATGEDLAEFHLHGGRAVIEAVLTTLASAGCRTAEPGEFTRRALLNGRIDLGEAEGLADLLSAETDRQRKEALLRSQGALGRQLGDWTRRLVDIAAEIEAAIDYDGEEDVAGGTVAIDLVSLRTDVARALAVPPAERLREGIRIAIIGPPNEGKSSLFNAIIGMDAAIVTDIAGTTRDLVERSVAIGGVPFQFVDTAGLRDSDDPVERIGIDRARLAATSADIALLLEPGLIDTDAEIVRVTTKVDVRSARPDSIGTSALTGEGIAELRNAIVTRAERLLPGEGEIALDRRHRDGLSAVLVEIDQAIAAADPLIVAERMRIARVCLDRVAGHAGLDDMLDALFERFCLGK